MKKHIIALATICAMSASTHLYAAENTSGFGISGGISMLGGDSADVLDAMYDQETTGVVLGATYTWGNGMFIFADYIPTVGEGSGSNPYLGLNAEISASMLAFGLGYETEKNFRFAAGLNNTKTEARVWNRYVSVSDSVTEMGLSVKGGYVFASNFTIDAGLHFIDNAGTDGVVMALQAGYKF
ncbi:porin family protein [Photobacterium japonica]|uniref:outer membrane beta-barrel protein n=1 Tax=Photobacterium japonica TaxID=2910235 RepID=UPI003D125ED3